MTPGIHQRIPFPEYLAIDAASKHGLDQIAESPAAYLAARQHPRRPTDPQRLGSAFHALLLEPEIFERQYIADPTDGAQTKDAKAERAELERRGLTILKWRRNADYWNPHDWDLLHFAVQSAEQSPIVKALLDDGVAEQTYIWNDTETGLRCKARPDWWSRAHDLIVDVKFTRDISPADFQRSAAKYRYHVQHAFYLWGAEQVGQPAVGFVFLVVQSAPPYRVELYHFDATSAHLGFELFRRDLKTLKECKDSARWPNGGEQIHSLTLPAWVTRTDRRSS